MAQESIHSMVHSNLKSTSCSQIRGHYSKSESSVEQHYHGSDTRSLKSKSTSTIPSSSQNVIRKCRQDKSSSQQRRTFVNKQAEHSCFKVITSYNDAEFMHTILPSTGDFADLTDDDNDNIFYDDHDELQTEFEETNVEKSEKYSSCTPITSFPNDDLPSSVDEYTDVFEKVFIDRKSNDLKQEIIADLMSLDGVETVAVGFSTEKEVNCWPVIRVAPNEETCKNIMESTKECFVDKIASTLLKGSLQKISVAESCSLTTFLVSAIEIALNYPLKESILRTAGEILTTKYKYADHENRNVERSGTTTCSVQNKVNISKDGHQREYSAQYQIACLHPIVPTNSQYFHQVLPPLPSRACAFNAPLLDPNAHTSTPSLKYEFVDHDISDLVHVVGPENDAHLMRLMLQLTLFPEHASLAFEKVKEFKCELSSLCQFDKDSLPRNPHAVKFLFGKAGLFGFKQIEKEKKFLFVLTNKLGNPDPVGSPFRRHPCNVDIGVYDYLLNQKANEEYESTFETVFKSLLAKGDINLPQKPNWRELPPGGGIRDMRGTVVYIRKGVVRKLSDRLSVFKPVNSGCHSYPTYMWKLDPQSIVSPGDSGSPVFLLQEDTFYFMGSLITDTIASPIHFGLQIIGVDIALHHIQQIISQLEDSEFFSNPLEEHEDNNALRVPQDIDVDSTHLIEYLEKYKSRLESHKKEQLLSPLPTVMLSELIEDNTIQGDMEFKIERNLMLSCQRV